MIAQFDIHRDTLYDEVWQTPMIELGKKYGVSRATIKWACQQLHVALPPQAYWIHRKRGHLLARPQLLPALPGQPMTISRAALVKQEPPTRRRSPAVVQRRTEQPQRATEEQPRHDKLIAPSGAKNPLRSMARSVSVTIAMKPLFIDLPTAAASVSLSVASVQKLVREDRFPKARLLSDRRVGWLVREVEEWAEGRPISDLLPPPNTDGRKKRESDEQ